MARRLGVATANLNGFLMLYKKLMLHLILSLIRDMAYV